MRDKTTWERIRAARVDDLPYPADQVARTVALILVLAAIGLVVLYMVLASSPI